MIRRSMLWLALCGTIWTASADAAGGTPETVVALYHEGLIGAVSSPAATSDDARFAALAPVMDAAFDFETMVRTATGRHWRGADAETKKALLSAFRRVSIATYADQFAPAASARFQTEDVKDGPRGMKLVETRLVGSGDPVTLTYVLRPSGGDWRIIDVLLDGGISELALRASEYARILRDGGATALVATLREKAADLLED